MSRSEVDNQEAAEAGAVKALTRWRFRSIPPDHGQKSSASHSQSEKPAGHRYLNSVLASPVGIEPREMHIKLVQPSVMNDLNVHKRRIYFLDNVRLQHAKDTFVMNCPLHHVESHRFNVENHVRKRTDSDKLETNRLCRSIAYQDPNTSINHLISVQNIYNIYNEYELSDSTKPDPDDFPKPVVEKETNMDIKVHISGKEEQYSETNFSYAFHHKLDVYWPSVKLQTWATVHRSSEVIDFCDLDPYRSTDSAHHPNLLQVHLHRITHFIKLVHLVCKR